MLIIQIQVWLMLRRVFGKVIHFQLFNHINLFSSYLIHNTAAFDNENKPMLSSDFFNQVMSSQPQVRSIQPSLTANSVFKLESSLIENSIKLKNRASLEQDKKINNAVAQKLIFNDEIKTEKFMRNNTELEREKNSEILRNRMSRQFSQNCVMKIMKKINQFNQKLQSEHTKIGETKALKHEKNVIKAVYKIVSEELKDLDKAKQLLKIFASCNPSSLEHKKMTCNTTPKWENYFDQKKIYKSQIIQANYVQKDLPIEDRQSSKNLHFINTIQKQNPTWLELKTNEQKNFSLSENNIKRVEKILFGNKKIIHDQAIFKRSNNPKSSQQTTKFGENWVYAYDLPYKFDKANASHLIKLISSKYGQITQFDVEDYSELVEKSTTQVIFSLPENYIEETSTKRVRIQKNEIEVCEQVSEQMNKNFKKSLVQKILKKGKDQQNLMLNKSTMVFKFKNKQDKINFLTGQMRLYGLCIDKFKNIRFQQAQSKNVISITMVPWECQTDEIVRTINSSLSSLNIKMHADPGIITSGYLFLELNNFGQALQSKRFLNGIPFQDKILKARLCYGSSYLHEGKYKYNYEMDHYEALLSKLEQLRQEHRLSMIR